MEAEPRPTAAEPGARTSGDVDGSLTPHSFEQLLEETRRNTDAALDGMPEILLEARRFITRELGLDPTAEELQTIVKISRGGAEDGVRRRFARELMTFRVLANRLLKRIFECPSREMTALQDLTSPIPELLQATETLEGELHEATNGLNHQTSPDDRSYLLELARVLKCHREPLLAARVLTPRLVEIARSSDVDALRAGIPTLDEEEVEIIAWALDPREAAGGPSRVMIDAVAIRSIMLEDIARWEAASQPGLAGERTDERDRLLEELEQDRIAYHVVSERLQKQQDAVLAANLEGFGEKLQGLGSKLFSAYLKFAQAGRDAMPVAAAPGTEAASETTAEGDVESDAEPSIQRLVEECRAGDERAEKQENHDQVYVSALKDLKSPGRARFVERLANPLRRRRHRIAALAVVAAVLTVVSVGVNLRTHRQSSFAGPQVSLSDFSGALPMTDLGTAGEMMYATVESWESLDKKRRMMRVREAGLVAANHGFKIVLIVDGLGRHVATWSKENGAKVMEPQAAPETAPPGGRRQTIE